MADEIQAVPLDDKHVIMTTEGAISGFIDVGINQKGEPLVRYAGSEDWQKIKRMSNETFDNASEIAKAIQDFGTQKDAAGNTVPFQL